MVRNSSGLLEQLPAVLVAVPHGWPGFASNTTNDV